MGCRRSDFPSPPNTVLTERQKIFRSWTQDMTAVDMAANAAGRYLAGRPFRVALDTPGSVRRLAVDTAIYLAFGAAGDLDYIGKVDRPGQDGKARRVAEHQRAAGRKRQVWRYADTPLNHQLDLTSLRSVQYHRTGSEGDVPGALVRSYSNRGRALQHVSDAGAAWYSAYLFAEKAGTALPEWRPSLMQVIDSLLGPSDVQDLIAAYLQVEHGYIALPARQVDSTLAYEYVLRHPSNGHLAVAQVKTGAQAVDTDTLPTADEDLRCFIFSPRHHYPADLPANVVPIDVEDIAAFVRHNPNALPPVVQRWAARAAD